LTSSAPGVTSKTITLGLIVPETGPGAPQYTGIVPAAQARIAQQNAQGGIDGRKIVLDVVDDQTSPAQDLTAAQYLLSKGVFGVIGESPVLFGGYQALEKAGVPVTGGGYDGPEWGQQPNTNMFSVTGPVDSHFPQYDALPLFMKQHGVTTVGSFGYSVSPSSTASAKGFMQAAGYVGLKKGYLNTSIPFGSVAVSPIALSVNSTGVNGMWMPLDDNTNFAIITAANQAGAHIKAAVSATGYGQALLDDTAAASAANGTYFLAAGAPVELRTTATKNFQAALAQYAHYTGVPDFGWYQGWSAADLMIKGLQMAGINPTRQAFMDQLHTVTNYDANGLLQPANLTLKSFGVAPQTSCSWYVQLQGKKFVPVPSNGQPTCGKLVPNSNQS
jgi:branched-chain amino acid transport system substrate-binding protein